MTMDDGERQELVARYSSWTDAALVVALTTDRHQYRQEVLPLMEDEARRRNLPLPASITNPAPSQATCSTGWSPTTAISKCFNRLRWSRLTWVGRGYLCILVWTFLPIVPPLIASTVAVLCGSALDEGSVHPCVILGCDIGGLLYAMGVMGWFMLLTFPTGFIGLMAFTIVVLVTRWRKYRGQGENKDVS